MTIAWDIRIFNGLATCKNIGIWNIDKKYSTFWWKNKRQSSANSYRELLLLNSEDATTHISYKVVKRENMAAITHRHTLFRWEPLSTLFSFHGGKRFIRYTFYFCFLLPPKRETCNSQLVLTEPSFGVKNLWSSRV